MTRKMHLTMVLLGAGNHLAGWRMPDAQFGSQNLALLQHVVSVLERGRFDCAFFADSVTTNLNAHPSMMVRLEPLTLLAALAMGTSRIGLVATVSTSFSEPYNVARMIASLDHLSAGRIGWNVVTTASDAAAANFGMERLPPHAQRYDRAEEFVKVVKGLWDSWEDDALVGDKKAGIYVNAAKMHELNHQGAYYQVKGPLNITRPPQGHPVIFQAGASDRGIDFAGATADVVFAQQQDKDEALEFSRKLRDACEAAGRPRDAVKILYGVCPIIGRTKDEARAIVGTLGALIDPKAAMRLLSERLAHDMSAFPLDEPVPELPMATGGMLGHARQLFSLARREKLTLRQLRDHAAASTGHRLVLGSPSEIADDLQSWFESGAADGFAVMSPFLPGPIEQFVDEVIPLLVQRGLFRSDYEGAMLRDHLCLPRPPHPAVTS